MEPSVCRGSTRRLANARYGPRLQPFPRRFRSMTLQLTRLTLKASPGNPGAPSTVTILVGPNNSGKSLALREIASWAAGNDASVRHVVDELDVEWPSDASAVESLLKPFETSPDAEEQVPANAFKV